jgi:putative aldouronate transport system substrate-binding protein
MHMRMPTKRNVSLLAVVLIFLMMSAACVKKTEPSGPFAGDAKGKPPAERGDVAVSMYDRGAVPSAEGSYEKNRWTKWINEKSPVNVNFIPIPRSESKNKFNVLFASGHAPDIVNEYDTAFRHSLYEQKQLLPLDDYLKYSPEYAKLLERYPQLRAVGTKPDGKLYEIGKITEAYPQTAIFIRTDWLKKLNLEVPRTTEDMYKVAKAFAENDPDGDGIRDTYGMNISFWAEQTIDQVFGAVGWLVQNGKVIRTWENEKNALQFKKRLYDEGLIDRDYLTDKIGSKAKQDFLYGKIGMYLNGSVGWFNFLTADLATLKKNVPGAEIIPMPYPKSPGGEFMPHVQNPVQMTTVINARTKDPEAVMRYLDFMMKPQTANTILYGEEGVHWKKGANGCPQVISPAKSSMEVDWANDYEMFYTRIQDKCGFVYNQFNTDDPVQKEGLELFKMAQKAYLDPKRQYPGITHYEHMPTLPNDLSARETSINNDISDLYVKAIVSGGKYSAEQAVKDAQEVWDKGGGKQIEQFMNQWYADNKDKAFLAKDIFAIIASQQEQMNESS